MTGATVPWKEPLKQPASVTRLPSKKWIIPLTEDWIETRYIVASLDFVRDHKDLFITVPTGTGKSYLASALGYKACRENYKVLYASTGKLMSALKLAKAKGDLITELKRIEKMDLLILDDFGTHAFDNQTRSILLDIIEDRHGKRSTLITSQIPVKNWYDTIGEKTIADAVLDRIVHQAFRVDIYGESLRKRQSKIN
jgi:DNA replication protein DnaC